MHLLKAHRVLLLGEKDLILLRGKVLLRLGQLASQSQVGTLRRLLFSHRLLHRLLLLVLRRPLQRRVVDVLHLAVSVLVLRRNVLQPDRLLTRLTPRLLANCDVPDSHYPRRRSIFTSFTRTVTTIRTVCMRRNDRAT